MRWSVISRRSRRKLNRWQIGTERPYHAGGRAKQIFAYFNPRKSNQRVAVDIQQRIATMPSAVEHDLAARLG
jgi:hypothetical protein